jgi:conjugative relaxase-like TrwC/TraI family protein
MIRMIQSRSASRAKKYFNDALIKSDYYINNAELPGAFQGRLVERLNLTEEISKFQFHALCENINPQTGDRLTSRNHQQRTVGYDINFHCPKSVSILHVLSKDNHILDAFRNSVRETMAIIEKNSQTRVRKNRKDENRPTEELLWAEFIHQTARPVKELAADPHLHAHCFTFNMTWDSVEQKLKAGQFQSIKRDMPYYQALFHKSLADNLVKLGYKVVRTKNAFEIKNVPNNVIELFSKRTGEIGEYARQNNISDSRKLDAIGGRTRGKKQKGMTMDRLKKDWRIQIGKLGMDHNNSNGLIIRHAHVQQHTKLTSKQCIDFSLDHCFERSSVAREMQILLTAYRHGLGAHNVTISDIDVAFNSHEEILQVKSDNDHLCTTRHVLQQEKEMVNLASQSQGNYKPFYEEAPPLNLDGQQAAAVQ